jgi:hypothetical protein
MLWVYADRYGIASSDGRHRFKAISFSHALSDDQRSGTITLYPEAKVLNIGAGADDYTCVRIFDEGGRDVGTMVRSFAGKVTWQKALGRGGSG